MISGKPPAEANHGLHGSDSIQVFNKKHSAKLVLHGKRRTAKLLPRKIASHLHRGPATCESHWQGPCRHQQAEINSYHMFGLYLPTSSNN